MLNTLLHTAAEYALTSANYTIIRNWCPQCLGKLLSFFIYSIHLFNAHLLSSLYQDDSRASYEHTVLYPKQESNLHLHIVDQILSLMRLPISPFGLKRSSFQAVTNASMVEVFNIIIRRIYFLVMLLMLLLKMKTRLTCIPKGLAIY